MPVLPNLSEIQSLLDQTKELLILTRENPDKDSLAASLALFLTLSATGKKARVACPTPSTVEFANLFAIDKVSQTLGSRNFIISLDYVEGSIDKVSYNISGDKFNLVIEPRPGTPPFSPEKVHYSSSTIMPDLIFVLGTADFEQLGKFYKDEKDLYSKVPVVNIDYHHDNTYFGKINLVDTEASSVSEIVSFFLRDLGFSLTQEVATNLLAGIDSATKNFSPSLASASAFEAAAFCLKAGGKRETEKEISQGLSQEAPPDWLKPKIFKSSTASQPVTPKDESTLL